MTNGLIDCPACGSTIQRASERCRYCDAAIQQSSPADRQGSAAAEPASYNRSRPRIAQPSLGENGLSAIPGLSKPRSPASGNYGSKILTAAILSATIGGGAYFLWSNSATTIAKEEVAKQLKDPSSAKFTDIEKCELPGGHYLVTGHVNAKNGFGAYSGKHFFLLELGLVGSEWLTFETSIADDDYDEDNLASVYRREQLYDLKDERTCAENFQRALALRNGEPVGFAPDEMPVDNAALEQGMDQ